MRHLRYLLVLVFSLSLGGRLRAHDPGLSTAQVVWTRDSLEVTTGFAPADAQSLLRDAVADLGHLDGASFDKARAKLDAFAASLWVLTDGRGQTVMPSAAHAARVGADNVSFTTVYPRPTMSGSLTLRAERFATLPPSHRQFVAVIDAEGTPLAKKFLTAADPLIRFTAPTTEAPSAPPTFWDFLKLGVQHIWTGYDHLLFLFALLVVCRSFRSIVAIVSCFTLAHSLTLALATLNLVNLPSRFTEPAIAASIVFVGLENLWRQGEEPRGRWALTFAFGLIHGFGFATVLKDLGVGGHGQSIAVPLLTFNLGVELGQITVAAIVLPAIWRLRKYAWFAGKGVIVLSAVVAGAGVYWFLQRILD